VRRRHDGHPAGHRLDDRHPEALEERRVDDDARTPIEPREIRRRRVAEADDARHVERRRASPPGGTCDGKGELAAEEPVRVDEGREVLARLERRDRQHVRTAEIHPLALG
jgi:hypothetical protein